MPYRRCDKAVSLGCAECWWRFDDTLLVSPWWDIMCRILLNQMAPEHKFATAAKLCQDILGGFADQSFDLMEASEVLRDALTILSSKEIKVSIHHALSCARVDCAPDKADQIVWLFKIEHIKHGGQFTFGSQIWDQIPFKHFSNLNMEFSECEEAWAVGCLERAKTAA